jgi:Probable cobalt transporter subunit (CbtA)
VPLSRSAADPAGTGVPAGGPAAPDFRTILSTFALAGLAAGALATAWSLLVTEVTIAHALRIEQARAIGEPVEGPLSRVAQVLGGALGTLVAGIVVALVTGVVFAQVRHRLPARTDFARVLAFCAIGFGVLGLLPAIAIPANPPGVGDSATIGQRTALYGAVVLGGVVVALLVTAAVSALRSRGAGPVDATIGGVVVGAVLLLGLQVLLPANPDRILPDVPADVVWDFRLASLGQLAAMWTTLALVAGALLDRRTRDVPPRRD